MSLTILAMTDIPNEWREYVAAAERKGSSREQIRAHLLKDGRYDERFVDGLLERYYTHKTDKKHTYAVTSVLTLLLVSVFMLVLVQNPSLTGFATIEGTTATIYYDSALRTIPSGFYGAVTGGITGAYARIDTNEDLVLDTTSDYALHRQKILEAGITQIRFDIDMTNIYRSDGGFNAYTSCNTCNINNHKTTVAWAAENNITVRLVAAYMPTWLANTVGACASNPTRCEPTSYTTWGNGLVAYLDEVECDLHPGTCVVEVWNEPYGKNFWMPDGTCQQRIDSYFRMYDNTRAALKAAYPDMVVSGPAGWFDSSCSNEFTRAFLGNYTSAQVDEFTIHAYSSSGNNDLDDRFTNYINTIRSYGHTEPICFTEYNANNANINLNEPHKHVLYLTDTLIEVLNKHDNISCLILYEWTRTTRYGPHIGYPYPAWYIMFSEPALDNEERASFNVSRDFSATHPPGSTIVDSVSSASTIKILGSSGSHGQSFTVANDGFWAPSVTVALIGTTANTVTNLATGAVYPVENDIVNIGVLDAYSVNHYSIQTAIAAPPNSAPTMTTPLITSSDSLNTTASNLLCTATVTDAQQSQLNVTTTWVRDGTDFATSVASVANSTAFTATLSANNTSPAQTWRCRVQATDGIAVSAAVTSTSSVTIQALPDVTAPVVSLSAPADGVVTLAPQLNVTWTATDNRDAALSCTVLLDNAPAASVVSTNNTASTAQITLTNGTHTLAVTCVDDAANSALSTTHTVTYTIITPTSTPYFSSTTDTSSGSALTGAVVTWSATSTDVTPLASWWFTSSTSGSWTSSSEQALTGSPLTSTLQANATITAPKDSTVCGYFTVRNAQGATNTSAQSCFVVANTAPTLSAVAMLSNSTFYRTGEDLQCVATTSDADNDSLTTTVTWLRNGTVQSTQVLTGAGALAATLSATATQTGETWSCAMRVSDGTNNTSAQSSAHTITEVLDTLAPTMSMLLPTQQFITESTTVTFRWNVSEETSVATCSLVLNGEPVLDVVGNGVVSRNVTDLARGDYNYTLTCSDESGNSVATAVRNFTISSPQKSSSNNGGGGGGGSGGGGGGSSGRVSTTDTSTTETAPSGNSGSSNRGGGSSNRVVEQTGQTDSPTVAAGEASGNDGIDAQPSTPQTEDPQQTEAAIFRSRSPVVILGNIVGLVAAVLLLLYYKSQRKPPMPVRDEVSASAAPTSSLDTSDVLTFDDEAQQPPQQ